MVGPRIALVLGLAFLATALAPAAAQGGDATADAAARKTSFVTFYGHIFDVGRPNPMPMNTEFPRGEGDFSAGYGGTCTDAVPDVSCEAYAMNEAWFTSTAGFVDVVDSDDFFERGGYGILHNERGLTKPIVFDTGQDVTAVFYMSADLHGWPSILCNPNGFVGVDPDLDDVPWIPWCFNWDPGVLYQWQIEATLYGAVLGDHGSGASEQADIAAAYAGGTLEVLAQGVSTPIDVVSLEALGQPTVWKFDVNLGKPAVRELPKEKSLIWRVQWHALVNGVRTLEDNVMSWNVNAGEFYPPSITLPVKNAFDVELVLPQFLHDRLVIHGILNTPWGSYDADPKSVALTVAEAASGRERELTRYQVFADYSVAHGAHYKPVNVTYIWDYKGDGLPPGEYRATITASNHQASATGTCSARFVVHGNGHGEVLEVGRCGYVSDGAASFEERQSGSGAGSAHDGPGLDHLLPLAPVVGLFARRRWAR